MSRAQFRKFICTQAPLHLVIEGCATSHYWGRFAQSQGHQVTLLHPNYVKPYVRRSKTDSADADALLRAIQDPELKPIPVKSEDHQALQSLHRLRERLKSTRVAHLNCARALLTEFGISLPKLFGEGRLAEAVEQVPELMRSALLNFIEQSKTLIQQLKGIDMQLTAFAKQDPICQQLLPMPSLGVTTVTAMVARVPDIHVFSRGRSFSNWLGITAREHSSGNTRHMGRITKQGDTYLRTLLIHCARSGLLLIRRKVAKEASLTRLERWAYQLEQRVGHNKAAVALANKQARIIWAIWTRGTVFDGNDAERFAH